MRIGAIEDLDPEELAALQRAKRKRPGDPLMEELLSQVEAGIPKKVPLAGGPGRQGAAHRHRPQGPGAGDRGRDGRRRGLRRRLEGRAAAAAEGSSPDRGGRRTAQARPSSQTGPGSRRNNRADGVGARAAPRRSTGSIGPVRFTGPGRRGQGGRCAGTRERPNERGLGCAGASYGDRPRLRVPGTIPRPSAANLSFPQLADLGAATYPLERDDCYR